MYPNLLVPLLIGVAALALAIGYAALRQPISRRLAERQLARRRSEVAVAVIGSILGTAIITGSLVVGDTLNFSVRQEAYKTLGPVDERIVATDPADGARVAYWLTALTRRADVDGVFTAQVAAAAAATARAGEPRVLAWDMDLTDTSRLGGSAKATGLTGPGPQAGHVVVNRPLADSLDLRPGDGMTLYLFGAPYPVRVDRVVAQRGLAGTGLGATVNRNVFLPVGMLSRAAAAAHADVTSVTFVSNAGGVQSGATHTDAVTHAIRSALGPISSSVLVQTPKRDVLKAAQTTGDQLGALFLMIGSFSIIAGALLLVNIFVMLADERTTQLGVLRAIGMRRSRMVGSFVLEGAAYVVLSLLPAVMVGIAVGWAVARIAARIFQSFSATGDGLSISFAVTPISLLNSAALGLIIGLVTIFATSVRISRLNVIAAIRDLPRNVSARRHRIALGASAAVACLAALASVPILASSQPVGSYVLPSLAIACAAPLLTRWLKPGWVITGAAAAVLTWCLVLPVLRPRLFDHTSRTVYVVEGTLLAFAGVTLISQNQRFILAPIRRLLPAVSEAGLAVRLAIAYPKAKRFRTGVILVMYTLITLVLVLLIQIGGIIQAGVDHNVASATAGYSMRVDVHTTTAPATLRELQTGVFPQVTGVTPLTTATATASDPGGRTAQPLIATAIGVPDNATRRMPFDKRLAGLRTDAAVWQRLATDSRYVVLDAFFGSTGGPPGNYYGPGDTIRETNPRSGHTETKIIAGILTNALVFYTGGGQAGVNPIVMSTAGARSLFGSAAQVSAALLKTAPGTNLTTLAQGLQHRYLASGLVATPTAAAVRQTFSANLAFFRLMEGFLALGLVVGITGLGVVMVRAVRERRRTIGVLRALGFHARTVQAAFLVESGLIAVQGVVLGSILGALTTWLMYRHSAAFAGLTSGYPIEWGTISALAIGTVLISVAATIAPARRAAQVRPAIAVRVAD